MAAPPIAGSPPMVRTGAAREYVNAHFGGPTYEVESNPTISTTVSILAKANPDRVGLVIFNLGANDVFFAFNNAVSITNGVKIANSGAGVSLDVTEDFTLVAREFDAISAAATSACYVLEIIRLLATGPVTG